MRYYLFLFFILYLTACGEKENTPDVSDINVSFGVYRTEEILFSSDNKDTLINTLETFEKNHTSFYNVYFRHIFPVGPADNKDSLAAAILDFKNQPLSDTIFTKIRKNYTDFSGLEKDLKTAFTYAKHYFPDLATPDIYTLTSEFGLQGFIFEGREGKDAIGVGLDMFLAGDQNYRKIDPDNPGFSDYVTRSWDKNHLVRKVLEVWLSDYTEPTNGNTLLDQMIYNGKKLYILDKFLPGVQDSIIFEYPKVSMEWCEDNEKQMWSFFIEKNLLQESNPTQIGKYVNPSPDSPGMPREAPGKTGNYIGYKIVKAYMDKNPEMTLPQLAAEKDAKKIYELSRYKPKR
ncbi:MAG: hypothetical protein IPN79_17250 [Saprospiraceae bacterium]|nr:hypothetical protein [Saprospiraceae bacterium]